MKRSSISLVLAGLMLASASVAEARGRGRPWGGPPGSGPAAGACGGGFGPGMLAALDLTAEQQEAIGKARDAMHERTTQTREALDRARDALHELWGQDQPSRDQILGQHTDMDRYRSALREAHIDFRLTVHGILTAEQRAKLRTMGPQGRGPHGPRFDGPPCWEHD